MKNKEGEEEEGIGMHHQRNTLTAYVGEQSDTLAKSANLTDIISIVYRYAR